MDNCDNSKNVTSRGWQSTELNWCHFSKVDTKKSLTLDKKDIFNLKIKMSFCNRFVNSAAIKYHSFFPLGASCVLNIFVSIYWEKTEFFGCRIHCLNVSIYIAPE